MRDMISQIRVCKGHEAVRGTVSRLTDPGPPAISRHILVLLIRVLGSARPGYVHGHSRLYVDHIQSSIMWAKSKSVAIVHGEGVAVEIALRFR